MPKKNSKKFQEAFLSHARGALFAVLFTLLAMTAYAAITYPADPGNVTGVVGLYAGVTGGTYDGNDATGYPGADAYCNGVVSGSHVCTPMEIINTYNNYPATLPSSGIYWINTGSPITVTPQVSDCNGWTSDAGTSTDFGNVWNFSFDAAGIQQCNSTRGYACCK